MSESKKMRKLAIGVGAGLLSFLLVQTVNATAKNEGKVTVCHIPPGNPMNRHEITVGSSAVRAHIAHGDNVGGCVPEPPEDPGIPF